MMKETQKEYQLLDHSLNIVAPHDQLLIIIS